MDLRCKYPSKVCERPRARKLNGDLHRLCEVHRQKANRNQMRWQRRRGEDEKRAKETTPGGSSDGGDGERLHPATDLDAGLMGHRSHAEAMVSLGRMIPPSLPPQPPSVHVPPPTTSPPSASLGIAPVLPSLDEMTALISLKRLKTTPTWTTQHVAITDPLTKWLPRSGQDPESTSAYRTSRAEVVESRSMYNSEQQPLPRPPRAAPSPHRSSPPSLLETSPFPSARTPPPREPSDYAPLRAAPLPSLRYNRNGAIL